MNARQSMMGARMRGFTLVELMITVTIIGVLALLASVGYARWIRTAKTAEATLAVWGEERLLEGLVRAIRTARPDVITVDLLMPGIDGWAFIDTLRNRPTRSLSAAEREEIAAIAKDRPNIDLEINFDYNSANISAKALPSVDALGKALSNPDLQGSTFVVAGHTDAVGSEPYNQDLSERRADAIKRYLVDKFGIAGTELVTVGYGKSKLFPSPDQWTDGPILICEGEKDTICALSHGFNACTHQQGIAQGILRGHQGQVRIQA